MLKNLNELAPFFEDCYRAISVREYAKLINISPPTASTLLKRYSKKSYLSLRAERKHLFFTLDTMHPEVIDLGRLYWKNKLHKLSDELQHNLTGASAMLFGSLSKAEVTPRSDIDIAIFAPEEKKVDIDSFKKLFKREIALYWYTSLRNVKNEHLLNNILNGVILFGKVKW